MILNKKQSFYHLAKKNRKSEKDIPDKFKVIKILKTHFKLNGLTGETIQIPGKIYHRMPDLYIPEIKTAIELDGFFHGLGEEITKSAEDMIRDEDYQKAGFKLILIFAAKTNDYEESQVIQSLQEQGLKRIG